MTVEQLRAKLIAQLEEVGLSLSDLIGHEPGRSNPELAATRSRGGSRLLEA